MGLLSQTSPIPRSPDGDNNSRPREITLKARNNFKSLSTKILRRNPLTNERRREGEKNYESLKPKTRYYFSFSKITVLSYFSKFYSQQTFWPKFEFWRKAKILRPRKILPQVSWRQCAHFEVSSGCAHFKGTIG